MQIQRTASNDDRILNKTKQLDLSSISIIADINTAIQEIQDEIFEEQTGAKIFGFEHITNGNILFIICYYAR